MAREIHDTLAQQFVGILLHLEAANGLDNFASASEYLAHARELAKSGLEDARRMLRLLSGRSHLVLTAVALAGARRGGCLVETRVDFRNLSAGEIDWYVGTGEPMDKAGGYGAQGIGSFLIRAVHGSYSNVVGLPLAETISLLAEAGVPLPWSGP